MATRCSCCGETTDTVRLHDNKHIEICSRCLDWLVDKRDTRDQARGGWRVDGHEPIFAVADVARSTDHYAKLGFEISLGDETSALAHRDRNLTIRLRLAESGPTASALYLHCHDADELAEEWRRAGLEVTGPHDEDNGNREGSHVDPDGNLIRFGSPVRA